MARHALWAAALLAACLLPRPLLADREYDVVVVGAGMAGLGAAAALQAAGARVLVLEGRDRIGGRTWTYKSERTGGRVDLGASWIHGVTGNPISDLVKEYGQPTVASNTDDNQLYGPDGRPVPEAGADALDEQLDEFLGTVRAFQKGVGDKGRQDTSLQVLADAFVEDRKVADQLAFDWETTASIVHEYAADLSQLSATWWDESDDESGGDAVLPQGYGALTARLAQGLDIRLGERVGRVRYGPAGVEVAATGGLHTAAHAIVTLPLGVLQAGSVAFDPQLPSDVQAAIGRLGMGDLEKVVLWFEEPFWDTDVQVLDYISPEPGAWAEWLSMVKLTGEPALVAFNAGSFARGLDNRTDAEVVIEALAALRAIYGAAVPEKPAEFVRTRWADDPWALGSYSYYAVGSSPEDRRLLARPLGGGSLLLAGEHVWEADPATVHGALLSGRAQAAAVAKSLGLG